MSVLSQDDERRLAESGIGIPEAERQLELLTSARNYAELVRPCTIDDGILRIAPDAVTVLQALHDEAARAGRLSKFVPASGAATRMFRELLHFTRGAGRGSSWDEIRARADSGETEARTLVTLVEELPRFAFHADLTRLARDRGGDLSDAGHDEILELLLGGEGLGYESLPKGLLGFHAYDEGSRTPFEEHLVEAAGYARNASNECRLHLTVSPEHRARFEMLLGDVRDAYEKRWSARYRVDFSVQKPGTDTLSVDADDRPLRDEQGRLLLRPGGHGALIENLAELDADLLYVKNIDNVQPDRLKRETLEWKRRLAGLLVRLQRRACEWLAELRPDGVAAERIDEAWRFLTQELNVRPDESTGKTPKQRRAYLLDRLDRPLRVCGVVPNTGEPGGGPFWVRGRDGAIAAQIVETAEVDTDDAGQQRLLQRSTHFNPVDLVCALSDAEGRPYDLHRFVDPLAAIVTKKSAEGRELKALERPGLWNGAMAGWNTVFVEVPLATFTPVKSILDLLRPEHQPAQQS
jgi:hypothetical protein